MKYVTTLVLIVLGYLAYNCGVGRGRMSRDGEVQEIKDHEQQVVDEYKNKQIEAYQVVIKAANERVEERKQCADVVKQMRDNNLILEEKINQQWNLSNEI